MKEDVLIGIEIVDESLLQWMYTVLLVTHSKRQLS